jgi:hypothetical protein
MREYRALPIQAARLFSSGIDRFSAFDKGIHQGGCNSVKHWPYQGTKHRIKTVGEFQFHPTGLFLTQGDEVPNTIELFERTVNQRELHLAARDMGVAGREAFVQATKGHTDAGGHAIFLRVENVCLITPGQKLRIGRDIHHQIKHFLGGEPDQYGLLNGFHRMGLAPRWHQGSL